jgi:hypothetical protein
MAQPCGAVTPPCLGWGRYIPFPSRPVSRESRWPKWRLWKNQRNPGNFAGFATGRYQGAIITIDAMGSLKAMAEPIIDGGGDYVSALKRNREKLHDGAVDAVIDQMENDFADVEVRRHVTKGKGDGRIETREYLQLESPKTLPGFAEGKNLRTIGQVLLTTIRDGQETTEIRFFISSCRWESGNLPKRFGAIWE